MKRLKKTLSLSLLLLLSVVPGNQWSAQAASVKLLECDFEDASGLPEGWLCQGKQFAAAAATDFGFTAVSGTNVLGSQSATGSDAIFTPKMQLTAGEKCTVKFSFIAPADQYLKDYRSLGFTVKAGSTQNLADHTAEVGTLEAKDHAEWETCIYVFTPEADGEYCFSIAFTEGLVGGSERPVAFDDFSVTCEKADAPGPVGPSQPGESFEAKADFDDDALYPGDATVPEGWLDDAVGFYRAAAEDYGITAKSGTKVFAATSADKDGAIYTPVYKLAGGKKATISFSLFTRGTLYVYAYGVDVTAGPAQNAESQTISVGKVEAGSSDAWKDYSFEFTPEEDGEYCFSLKITHGAVGKGSLIAFDDIVVSGETAAATTPVEPVDPTPSEAFEIEVNFDEAALYPDGASVPEGWLNDGTGMRRSEAVDYGMPAKSGDYVLAAVTANKDAAIYSPLYKLVAGKKATIEFSLYTVGQMDIRAYGIDVKAGTAQSADAQTIAVGKVEPASTDSWKDYKFDFTPKADGEYCFSLNITYGAVAKGSTIAIDDIFISGFRPVEDTPDPEVPLEPNEDNLADCIELPYIETFSDASHYDGTSHLPVGWHSTGSTVWVTANLGKLLNAVDGDYYMVTPNSTFERDEKAYTPFFNLTAGTEYIISFYSMIEGGWDDNGDIHVPTMEFSVGTEQDIEFHRTILTIDTQHTAWAKHELTFTPEISGPYCFAFALSGEANTGAVAVDCLTVTAPGLQARVEPGFAPMGIFDLYTSQLLAFSGKPVEFANTTRYGESYAWTLLLGDDEIATSTEVNPSFAFTASGNYTVTLAATNSRGTRTTSKSIDVIVVSDGDGNTDLALTLLNERSDALVDRGNIPSFSTDPDADFITGYNHYYHKFAQLFALPENVDTWIKQVSFWVTDRRFRNMTATLADDRIKPFSIVLYGVKEDGSLDPEKVFGRYDTTIGEAMGSTGLGAISGDPRFVNFPAAIKVTGPVFVAMEFDPTMTIDAEDPNIGRSYISTSCIKFGHGRGNFYVQPFAVPEGSVVPTDGSWCKLGDLDPSMSAYGANWELWLATENPASGITAVNPDGEEIFAVSLDAAGNILVSGTVEGETITVYNVAGALVATAVAEGGCTVIPAFSLGSGIYVVNAGAGFAKIVK